MSNLKNRVTNSRQSPFKTEHSLDHIRHVVSLKKLSDRHVPVILLEIIFEEKKALDRMGGKT